MLPLDQLNITQSGYRLSKNTRDGMVNYVRSGGLYDIESLTAHPCTRNFLIAVTRFEDGELFLRDGLHRATSIWVGREERVLQDSEYVIEDMTYDMWINPCPEKGWYTPFDPRKEVRKPDFLKFREKVKQLHEDGEDAISFINENRDEYCIPRRKIHTFGGVAMWWGVQNVVGI